MITPPNMFLPLEKNYWEVSNPNATDLWLQIMVTDALGSRRFVPEVGSTVQAIFQRPVTLSTTRTAPVSTEMTENTLTKLAVVDIQDASLCNFQLTVQDVGIIHGGTVKFVITQPTLPIIEWVENHFLKKSYTSAGW